MPNTRSLNLRDRLKAASATQLFWTFALFHAAVWTIVPSFTSRNAPLDVIEGYAWGHEWLMGTYKHPPMQAWVLEAFAQLSDRAPWAHFLASQIAVLVTFWAVWTTGRKITNEISSLTAVLLLEGVVYYNFNSTEFNPNVLQLVFWALSGWSFHRAVREGRFLDWVLLGLWAAAGLYSKYTMAVVLVVLAYILVSHPMGRKHLKTSGPWCAVLIAALLFVPHVKWLLDNQFMPLAYVEDRLKQNPEWHAHVLYPPQFLLGQLLVMAAGVLMFLTLPFNPGRKPPKINATLAFDRYFLTMIVICPFVIMLLMSAFAGLRMHDMWGTPLWNFVGLWAVVVLCPPLTKRSLRHFVVALGFIFVLGIAAYTGSIVFGPYVMQRPLRVEFPGRKLAQRASELWERTYHKPLQYVIGDTWLAGNIAYYAPSRPHVLIMGDYRISPWIDPEAIKVNGGILVWCADHCLDQKYANNIPQYLLDQFPQAKIQEPLTLLRETQANVPSVVIGWALVPPAHFTP
jgi:4-amino-4-deoxy-L-arabinose transferase-like glycosyltransferase